MVMLVIDGCRWKLLVCVCVCACVCVTSASAAAVSVAMLVACLWLLLLLLFLLSAAFTVAVKLLLLPLSFHGSKSIDQWKHSLTAAVHRPFAVLLLLLLFLVGIVETTAHRFWQAVFYNHDHKNGSTLQSRISKTNLMTFCWLEKRSLCMQQLKILIEWCCG